MDVVITLKNVRIVPRVIVALNLNYGVVQLILSAAKVSHLTQSLQRMV